MSEFTAGVVNGAVASFALTSTLWMLFIIWRDDRRPK